MRAVFFLGHHDIGLCVCGSFFFFRLVLFSEEVVQQKIMLLCVEIEF